MSTMMAESAGVGGHSYVGLLGRAKAALESSVDVAVSVNDLRPYPNQPRQYFSEDALRRLADSIDAGGQTTTGIIREKPGATNYELIDGERRWRAIQLIPASRRPLYRARLIRADDDVVQYLISGIANFNREGHTPIETSDAIRRLVGFELPMSEIASVLGISEGYVSQLYGLRNLDPEVRAMMAPEIPRREQLPVSAAIEIAKIDRSLQKGLAERVLRRDITLVGLRGEVIRTAKAANKPVQTREVMPYKKWERFLGQMVTAERAAVNMVDAVEAQLVVKFIQSRSTTVGEAREAAKRIGKIAVKLQALQLRLQRVVGGV